MSDFVKPLDEKNSKNPQKVLNLPKRKKYLTLIDEETGKTVGMFPLKSKGLGSEWLAVYQKMLLFLSQLKLSCEQYRVLFALLSKVDFENYLTISQTELAKEINMKQPNIARAIKGLCELNIIVEGPRAGLNKTYRLNPYVAHKGTDRENTILEFEKLIENKG